MDGEIKEKATNGRNNKIQNRNRWKRMRTRSKKSSTKTISMTSGTIWRKMRKKLRMKIGRAHV